MEKFVMIDRYRDSVSKAFVDRDVIRQGRCKQVIKLM